MHGSSGKTVNRGIVDINLNIWLAFGKEERGKRHGKWAKKVNRGAVNRGTTVLGTNFCPFSLVLGLLKLYDCNIDISTYYKCMFCSITFLLDFIFSSLDTSHYCGLR